MLKAIVVLSVAIVMSACSTSSTSQPASSASPSAGAYPPPLPFGDMRVVGPLDLESMPSAEFIPSPIELNAELAKLRIVGKATIGFTISPRGRPEKIRVVSASDPKFGELASVYVRRFVFRPAMRGGKATSCEMEIPFTRS